MENFQFIWNAAKAAGMAAGNATVPAPMYIKGYAPVADGVCGFAWVQFPGNDAFGKWAKKQGFASKAYPKGLWYWVGEFDQSLTKKEAFARAMAGVLEHYGIKAYAGSRID